MRKYRDVDATAKWMRLAVSEDMIIEALASSVIAEIQAQADRMAEQEIENSRLGTVIRDLEKENASLNTELGLIYDILHSLKMKQKVVGILEKNGVVPSF